MKLSDCHPGQQVYGYWESFPGKQDVMFCTIVRVNRKTVTVRLPSGDLQRVDPYELEVDRFTTEQRAAVVS